MAVAIRVQCLSLVLAMAANQEQILLQREKLLKKTPHVAELVQGLRQSDKSSSKRPCQCAAFDSAWQPPSRTQRKCIYIDLGAADGNSYQPFLRGQFGPVEDCGTTENPGDFEAFLVEANPFFDATLQLLSDTDAGHVHAMNSTAAYMCDASTTFFLDDAAEHNYWGSNMDGKLHKWPGEALINSMAQVSQVRAGARAGHEVTVPTINLLRLLYEKTIPGDWVIVKMDVEGAEWDIVPCLANSPVAPLIDQLYVEEHPIDWQLGNTTREEMDSARQTLTQRGIQMPPYWSPTL
jgi:hypothetical protein